MADQLDTTPTRWRKIVVAIAVFVFGLWVATPFVAVKLVGTNWAELGQSGDLFGGVNALFSGLAFAGVIIAILLQREELQLQRQELRQTREEMKRTADAQELAQKALNQTIWAQSFKVAVDIMEAGNAVDARRQLYRHKEYFIERSTRDWGDDTLNEAMTVIRTFETVGTIVRRGLVPLEYIDGWSISVTGCWRILERSVLELRAHRADPFLGRDFQWLAGEMKPFVPPGRTAVP